MRAIEFKGTAHQHLLRLPDTIPDGVSMRVLLLLEEESFPVEPKALRKPSPKLAGSVIMFDDWMSSAIEPDDWNALT